MRTKRNNINDDVINPLLLRHTLSLNPQLVVDLIAGSQIVAHQEMENCASYLNIVNIECNKRYFLKPNQDSSC